MSPRRAPLSAWIRSILFVVLMTLVTVPYSLVTVAVRPLPPLPRHRIVSFWAKITAFLIWHVLGIRWRVEGRENIPARPCVFLAKHQSAWETLVLEAILPRLVFVLKKELLRIPFIGWGLASCSMIAIDRNDRRGALQQVIEQGKERLAQGFSVLIFPEGTRVAPGHTRRYLAGGAALAVSAGVPVVPIAHNAGEFWPKGAFVKIPGEVLVSIGPPIDPQGKSVDELNRLAAQWIEAEMRRRFPWHYGDGDVTAGARA